MKFTLSFLLIFMLFIISCENSSDPLVVNNQQTDLNIEPLPGPTPPPSYDGCARTPGYWKNHPEAWPVMTATLGGVYYTQEEMLDLLNQPERANKSLTIFRALLATYLNLKSNADPTCIYSVALEANAWLVENPIDPGTKASSMAWSIGEPLYLKLDAYNNGFLCAPHCD